MRTRSPPIVKITPPVLDRVFRRERLYRLLDRVRKRPIVWISGPPGSGKTMLAASYLASRKDPCLWYRVDEGDQDVASFFHHMGLAALKVSPGKRKPLPRLTPEYLSHLSGFTLRYFEDFFGRLKRGTVVVFDDFQKVPAATQLHEVVVEGLSCLPEGINAFLVSRSGPPPVFSRTRVHRRMEEIGWKELRLTPGETKGIARLRGKRRPGGEEIRHLHDRSDGWTAGLVLLLERGRTEGMEPQRLDAHTPQELFDYFGTEVFERLDKAARSFLLRSAFLPRMTARMAQTITRQKRSDLVLTYLSRNNYFTEKHPSPEPVYGYHSLFRRFLLSRAREAFSGREIGRLRKAAASALEKSGFPEDAAALYAETGDWEGLSRVILAQAPRFAQEGRFRSLKEWLTFLPMNVLHGNPWLLYWLGECLLPFDPLESRRNHEEAFRIFREGGDGPGAFRAWSGVASAIVYGPGSLKDFDSWFSRLDDLLRAHGDFPSPGIEAQVMCTAMIALGLRRPPGVDMEEWAKRAVRLAGSTGDIPLKFSLLLNTAHYRFHSGDVQAVGLHLDSLRSLSRRPEITPLPRLRLFWLEAAYANLCGLHDRCRKVVTEGLEYADASGVHLMDFLLWGHGALCCLHGEDLPGAKRFLENMAAALPAARPWEAAFYHRLSAWEALHRGDLAKAAFHSDRCLAICEDVGNPWTEGLARLQRAFLCHRKGEEEDASRHLERARRIGDERGMRFVRFACLMAAAYFAMQRGEEGSAKASLREGLRIGRETGYVDTYLWHPGLLEEVAAFALEEGIEVEYVRDLIRRNRLVPAEDHRDVEAWPWPLAFHTLGRFVLFKEGRPVPPSRKEPQKPLQMLKLLIAMGGRDVPEDRITDVLWPDADGDLAHNAYSTTLYRLRRLIGSEDALSAGEGGLTLSDRNCWVDAWAFERTADKAAKGRRDGVAGDGGQAYIRLAEKAVGLYKGPFLEGEDFAPQIRTVRDRLRGKFLRCVEELARRREVAGEWDGAIEIYRKGLEADDLSEELHRRLILSCQRTGRQSDALSAYRRCRDTLAVRLGRAPSPETEAVAKGLLERV